MQLHHAAIFYCLLLNQHTYASLYSYWHCNISDSQQHLNQRRMKRPGFHNTEKNCSRWTNPIWTWLQEVMSCSASEASFFLQAIGSWANNPARGASQVRRHCEGWIMTSLKMFLWLKAWNGRLVPQREDLKDPTFLTLLAWGRLLRLTRRKEGRKDSFSRFQPFLLIN